LNLIDLAGSERLTQAKTEVKFIKNKEY